MPPDAGAGVPVPNKPPASTPESMSSVERSGSTLSSQAQIQTSEVADHKGLQFCLDLFFERHFTSDFCSFDHRPDFEQKCRRDPFLSSAIISLCGRYLEPQDAQSMFGLASAREISRRYLPKARNLAKASLDEPSGMFLFSYVSKKTFVNCPDDGGGPVSHIQGNLVLAMAELLSNSGSRHWLFAGTAIRMAEIMRLNKDFHQNHSLKDQEVRRRAFWACLLFDRTLAYLLAKHRTISLENIAIAVPGTDASLAYQEATRGVTLNTLAAYQRPSDLGLSPYLIKTVCLWSDLADFTVYSRRRLDRFPPNDPRSTFFAQHEALKTWAESLPPSLWWSVPNYTNQCALGQKKAFVAMQFLLHSASCVAHQCFLPHVAMYTKAVDLVDAAGWSYFHRDEAIVDACVSNALAVGEMLAFLMDPELGNDPSSLQTIWVAASTLTAANTWLWLQYAQDEAYAGEEIRRKAAYYFGLASQLVSSWTSEWRLAKQWLMALYVMHDLYKAAYLGEINENILGRDRADPDPDSDDGLTNDFRPQPGDGYPSVISLPNVQACVKFATGDTSAKSISILSVWLQLSGGWPYGFAGSELLLDSDVGVVQLGNDMPNT